MGIVKLRNAIGLLNCVLVKNGVLRKSREINDRIMRVLREPYDAGFAQKTE
jgi:hypothetical protein